MNTFLNKWNSFLKENIDTKIMYHVTSEDRLDSIMKDGLKINSKAGKSRGSLEYMLKVYQGVVPIFLSISEETGTIGTYVNGILLEVDATGLELVADIPTLVDKGAELKKSFIKYDDFAPEQFWDLLDSKGRFTFDQLNNDKKIIDACIEVTKTAACKDNISADRIKILRKV